MADESRYLVSQAAVEIKYRQGMVFFDRCGSTMVCLEEELGAAFAGTVPTMEYGQLVSQSELLTVRYGPKSFVVSQQWLHTPARLVQIAGKAWEVARDKLDVGHKVTRSGARFWLHWPFDSEKAAWEALSKSQLVAATEQWTSVFGKHGPAAFSAISEDIKGKKTRVELSIVKSGVELSLDLATKYDPFLYKWAVQLDIDHSISQLEQEVVTVGHGNLKEFIRTSWESTKEFASTLGTYLR